MESTCRVSMSLVDKMYTAAVTDTYTTVKVTKAVRDELNAVAASQGRSAGGMIAMLLEEYRWRLKVEEAKRAMREAPQEVWEDYLHEVHLWDSTASDGLRDDPWQP